MWFSGLNITSSQVSGRSARRRVFEHWTPPNPPPTMTILYSAMLLFSPARLSDPPCKV